MQIEVIELIGALGVAAISALIGGVVVQRIRTRGEERIAQIGSDDLLRQQSNEVSLKLMNAADERFVLLQQNLALHADVAKLERDLSEVRHAWELLRQIVFGDEGQQKQAIRNARAFLDHLDDKEEKA